MLICFCVLFGKEKYFGRNEEAQELVKILSRLPFQASKAHFQGGYFPEIQEDRRSETVVEHRSAILQVEYNHRPTRQNRGRRCRAWGLP